MSCAPLGEIIETVKVDALKERKPKSGREINKRNEKSKQGETRTDKGETKNKDKGAKPRMHTQGFIA